MRKRKNDPKRWYRMTVGTKLWYGPKRMSPKECPKGPCGRSIQKDIQMTDLHTNTDWPTYTQTMTDVHTNHDWLTYTQTMTDWPTHKHWLTDLHTDHDRLTYTQTMTDLHTNHDWPVHKPWVIDLHTNIDWLHTNHDGCESTQSVPTRWRICK